MKFLDYIFIYWESPQVEWVKLQLNQKLHSWLHFYLQKIGSMILASLREQVLQ